MQKIERFIHSLDNEYEYTDEGDIKSYSGIDVSKPSPGSYKLSQPHLFRNILTSIGDMKLNSCKEPTTPKEIPVGEGEPMKTNWNYRSILGQLNYLTCSTRGKLAFSVHQCVQFAATPKLQHEKALKKIHARQSPNHFPRQGLRPGMLCQCRLRQRMVPRNWLAKLFAEC
jgi:hypothetical protein